MSEGLTGFVLQSGPTMPGTKSDSRTNADGPQSAVSDEQLMVSFSRGSTDAFGELFSRYRQPMFGFFRRRVADPAQAEELTQETFLAVLRGASRYEPAATFRTYLYTIGLNILRSYRRKAAFRGMFSGTGTEGSEAAARSSLDTEIVLRDAVSRLERVDREILLLREFEQLSYAEIAEVLRLPLNTVRTRLFRARTALRELLTAPARGSNLKSFTEDEERA